MSNPYAPSPSYKRDLAEAAGTQSLPGQRNMSVESQYEYGSRAGWWRL